MHKLPHAYKKFNIFRIEKHSMQIIVINKRNFQVSFILITQCVCDFLLIQKRIVIAHGSSAKESLTLLLLLVQ